MAILHHPSVGVRVARLAAVGLLLTLCVSLSVAHRSAGASDPSTSPALSVPHGVMLGERLLGSAGVERAITVRNRGTEPITLAKSTLRGADVDLFRVTADGCAGVTLGADATCTITVRFTPSRAPVRRPSWMRYNVTGELVIGGGSATPTSTSLYAKVLLPASLIALTREASFGATPVRREGRTRRLWLRSAGDFDAPIRTLSLTGAGASQFALVGEDTCTGAPMQPGSGCYYDVLFRPTRIGEHAASIVVTGRDHTTMTATVHVTGVARPPVTTTMRRLARVAARRVAGVRLRRALGRSPVSLGAHRWPMAGRIRVTIQVRLGHSRQRVLAWSRQSVDVRPRGKLLLRRSPGARRAFRRAGRRPRVTVRLELREPSGERTVAVRRLRVRGLR